MPKLNSAADLESCRNKLLAAREPDRTCVTICSGTGCHAQRSDKVSQAFVDELERNGLTGQVDILRTGCLGLCEQGTLVGIRPQGTTYLRVRPEDVPEIVTSALVAGEVVTRLLCRDEHDQEVLQGCDIPFYKHQTPV